MLLALICVFIGCCHNLITTSSFLLEIERRKIERSIRRLEKLHRTSSAHGGDAETAEQLNKLKEDLEYVRVRSLLLHWLLGFSFTIFNPSVCLLFSDKFL